MKISVLPMVNSWNADQVETETLHMTLAERATSLPKNQSPLWSPILYKGTSRKAADAVCVGALVFDFDSGRPDLPLLTKTGLKHVWHTTHSHTSESPKWRLIVELDKPIPAADWAAFYAKAAELLEVYDFDASCADLAQFYYIPPAGAAWEVVDGKPLPTADISAYRPADARTLKGRLLRVSNPEHQPQIRRALAGKPLAPPGQRRATVLSLGFYLGKFIIDPPTPASVVVNLLGNGLDLPGNSREPTRPKEHWVKLFTEAFNRGRNAREDSPPIAPRDWQELLQKVQKLDGSTSLLSNTHNAAVILKHEGTWAFRNNTLEGCLEMWDSTNWRRLTDGDCTNISNWLQLNYRINIGRQLVYDQIEVVAPRHDPLMEYLKGLEWDGVTRLETFLPTYFGCEDTPTVRMYSKHWLIALVARAVQPGCKMDNVLVLQGPQGYGKSTALRCLTEPWFSDTKITIGDKDSLMAAGQSWCHEFAELASLKKADLETIKAFFASQQDTFRPPYGRTAVVRPRRCVFVATTNEMEFLNDSTGARRFWVAKVVKRIDFAAIKAVRGQVLAEAYKAYNEGVPYWLATEVEQSMQRDDAEAYRVDDGEVWESKIREWWFQRPKDARPAVFELVQVCSDILDIPVERVNYVIERQVRKALAKLGFKQTRPRRPDGTNPRVWTPPATWYVGDSQPTPTAPARRNEATA